MGELWQPKLADVPEDFNQWGCIDRREGPLYFGIPGGAYGLGKVIALTGELQRNSDSIELHEHVPKIAKLTQRALENVGVQIVLHQDCKAIGERLKIARTITDSPEQVMEPVREITQFSDIEVTDTLVQRAADFYDHILAANEAYVGNDGHVRDMYRPGGELSMPSVDLVPSTASPQETVFVVNATDRPLVRNGRYYDFSLGSLRPLEEKVNETGLFRLSMLGEAAVIHAAATQIVLGKPDIVHVARAA